MLASYASFHHQPVLYTGDISRDFEMEVPSRSKPLGKQCLTLLKQRSFDGRRVIKKKSLFRDRKAREMNLKLQQVKVVCRRYDLNPREESMRMFHRYKT